MDAELQAWILAPGTVKYDVFDTSLLGRTVKYEVFDIPLFQIYVFYAVS